MRKRKQIETQIVEQLEANGGRLTIDLEYTPYEFRLELEKMERQGKVSAVSTSSMSVTYQLKFMRNDSQDSNFNYA